MPRPVKGETNRYWVRMPADRAVQMEKWAEDLGIPLSQFFGMVAWVGAQQMMRTFDPQSTFTTEQWGQIVASAMKTLPQEDMEKARDLLIEESAKYEIKT